MTGAFGGGRVRVRTGMGTGEVIVFVASGVVLAALLCLFVLVVAVRWTRRHPDRENRHDAPGAVDRSVTGGGGHEHGE